MSFLAWSAKTLEPLVSIADLAFRMGLQSALFPLHGILTPNLGIKAVMQTLSGVALTAMAQSRIEEGRHEARFRYAYCMLDRTLATTFTKSAPQPKQANLTAATNLADKLFSMGNPEAFLPSTQRFVGTQRFVFTQYTALRLNFA